MTANEIALTAVKALDSKKGQDIKCLETGHLTTLADYFVLCTATSTTQIKALADVCEKALKDAGEPPHHVEGHRGGTWILLDFSSVVVHIFNEEAREFYDLERLWSDAAPPTHRAAARTPATTHRRRRRGPGFLRPSGSPSKMASMRPSKPCGTGQSSRRARSFNRSSNRFIFCPPPVVAP